MLDPKLIREDPDNIKKNLARRRDPKLEGMVDDFIKIDQKWRKVDQEVNLLRKQRNEFAKKISKSSGDEKQEIIAQMKTVKQTLEKKEAQLYNSLLV